jgi:N-acetylmuramic acid 6-phosphate etherase
MTDSSDDPPAAGTGPQAAATLSGSLNLAPSGPAGSPTEQRNPRTADIDLLPTRFVLELLNREDELVPAAVRPVLTALGLIVDEAADRVRKGGRVHYFGAGSSGRIAVLDAAELVPTFGLEHGIVAAHLAGGDKAMTRATEGLEDDPARGRADTADVRAGDVVIGLTASGRTPYVAGALAGAADRGAFSVLVTCNPSSPLRPFARACVVADTGPEAIAGSTRLKATSALKLILNSFSTALMIRLGKTYSNLMIEAAGTNSKLRARLVRILIETTGAAEADCAAALARAGGDVKLALVDLLGDGDGMPAARQALGGSGGSVRGALARLGTAQPAVPGPAGRLMAAEMAEQPGILRALAGRSGELAELAGGSLPDPLAGVLIVAAGPAAQAGLYGCYLLEAATGRPGTLLRPGARPSGLGPREPDCRGYLAVAVGGLPGEPPEVAAMLDRLQRAGARGLALTADPAGPLASVADAAFDLRAGPQRSAAATKTVTASLLALALLAGALDPRVADPAALARVPGEVGALLGDPPDETPAGLLSTARGLISVGSGYLYPAASETARALTAVTPLLVTSCTGEEFRQEPAGALRPGVTVLACCADPAGHDLAAIRAAAAARGAELIGISPDSGAALRVPADLPASLLPVAAVVRGQQLARAAALLTGRDPDRPGGTA